MEYSAWLADNELVPIDKASLVPRMLRGGSPLKRTNRGTFSGNGVGGFVRRHPDLAHTGGLDRVAGVKLKQFQKDSPSPRKSRVSRRVKTGLLVGAGVAAGAAGVAVARHHGVNAPGLRGKGKTSYNLSSVQQHRRLYDSPEPKREFLNRPTRNVSHAAHVEREKHRLRTETMGRVIAHDIDRQRVASAKGATFHGGRSTDFLRANDNPKVLGPGEIHKPTPASIAATREGSAQRGNRQARFNTNERNQYEGRKLKTLAAAEALHGKRALQSQTAHAVLRHKDVERTAMARAAQTAAKSHIHRMATDAGYATAVGASEHRIDRLESLHTKASKHWGPNNKKTNRIAGSWKQATAEHEKLIGNVRKSAGGFVVTRPRLVAA